MAINKSGARQPAQLDFVQDHSLSGTSSSECREVVGRLTEISLDFARCFLNRIVDIIITEPYPTVISFHRL